LFKNSLKIPLIFLLSLLFVTSASATGPACLEPDGEGKASSILGGASESIEVASTPGIENEENDSTKKQDDTKNDESQKDQQDDEEDSAKRLRENFNCCVAKLCC